MKYELDEIEDCIPSGASIALVVIFALGFCVGGIVGYLVKTFFG